jgi:hypothetical protein
MHASLYSRLERALTIVLSHCAQIRRLLKELGAAQVTVEKAREGLDA